MARLAGQPSVYGSGGNSSSSSPPGGRPVDPDAVVVKLIEALEIWAEANRIDARRDRLRYWSLKVPAIVCSASVSAFAAFNLQTALIIVGAIGAVAIAIDAAMPGGLLHNVHRKGFNEIRALAQSVNLQWEACRASTEVGTPARITGFVELLKSTEQQMRKINEYITAAEASLGEGREVSTSNAK